MDPSINLEMLQQFHFIRPEWLWGLPLFVLLWLVLRNQPAGQQWSSHIPKEMLAALQIGTTKQSNAWKWSLLILWLGVIIAAAGPSWDKQDSPTVQNQKALVLLLDLSPSMLAQDLMPDRLSRAKYKLIDVLRLQADGQVALIAYAGDAHTVSPLTDDPKTIQALLPALHPDIMPSRGSNTEAAIELAQQLLHDAGLGRGDMLLITDGVSEDAIETIIDDTDSNYRLSVLAVGGGDAAPVPEANGGFLRGTNGDIILSAVNGNELRSMATRLGGRFSMLTSDNADIESLITDDFEDADTSDQAQLSSVVYDAWVDMGHWLVLLILPLALILFRKGTIYLLPLCIPLLLLGPSDSYADTGATATSAASAASKPAWQTAWNNLWQTPDQQASEQFSAGDFDSAAKTFQQKDWAALSNYKNGDYQQAIEKLQGLDDITSLYNKGNALAFNGQLQEAIDAYQQVLDQQPDHPDADHNKSVVEQLLQQSDQQQKSDDSSDENSQDESSEQSDSESQASDSESQPSNEESQASDGESQPSDEESQDQSEQQQQSDSEEKAKQQASAEDAEQQSEDESEQQSQAEKDAQANAEDDNQETESTSAMVQIEDTDQPLQDSSEQWLRTIPDDPSGLLRRKFDYQAHQRLQQSRRQKNDKAAQQRY